jgi:hypothetical protein
MFYTCGAVFTTEGLQRPSHMYVKHASLQGPGIRTLPIALKTGRMVTVGFQTILTFPLFSNPAVETPKRIQRSPGQFHHPLGDPTIPIEEGRR